MQSDYILLKTKGSDKDIERYRLTDIKDFIPRLQKIEFAKVDFKLAKEMIE